MSEENKEQKSAALPTISYQRSDLKRGPNTGFQVVIGAISFFVWLGVVVPIVLGMNQIQKVANNPSYSLFVVAAALVGLLIFAFYIQHLGWRAFFPGLLIGFGLSLLIGCGICGILLNRV